MAGGAGGGSWGGGSWGGSSGSVNEFDVSVNEMVTLSESLGASLPLKALTATTLSPTQVEITFSYDLDTGYSPHTTPSNYVVSPPLAVFSAAYGSSNTIVLQTDPQVEEQVYTIAITSARADSSDSLDPNYDEVSFYGYSISTFIAAAQSAQKVMLTFSQEMLVDTAFVTASNYEVRDLQGNVVAISSVEAQGSVPVTHLTINLSGSLTKGAYYVVEVDSTVKTTMGASMSPDTVLFQWRSMVGPLTTGPLTIPISSFSGEVSGGILGTPAGLIFFSPALDVAVSGSTIQVDEISLCTRAYDVYSFPEPVDPPALFTYSPSAPSAVLGTATTLWSSAESQGLARVNLTLADEETLIAPDDPAVTMTLVEPINITRAAFLNDDRWVMYDGVGTNFITAENLTAIGAGPTTVYSPYLNWWGPSITPVSAYLVNPQEYTVVSQWGDDTGNGLMLQSSNGTSEPSFDASVVDGDTGIVFASGDDLIGLNASDWTHLHSGEYWVAGVVHAEVALNTQTIMSTFYNGTNRGLRVLYNGGTRTLWFMEYNATGLILSCQLPNLTLPVPPDDFAFVFTVSRSGGSPHARLYVDGVLGQTADYTGDNWLGDPSQPLRLAYAPGTGNYFASGAAIHCLLTGDTGLTSDQVSGLFAAMSAATSGREVLEFVCFGDSITEGAQSYRRQLMTDVNLSSLYKLVYHGTRPQTANFPLVDGRHEGFSGQTVLEIRDRVDAYTATTETGWILLAGTNSIVSRGAAGALSDLGECITSLQTKFPGKPGWVFEIPYGTGGTLAFTEGSTAGDFNAGLDALLATFSNVTKIPIHAAGGATTFIWDPVIHAGDDVGHPTVLGGELQGHAAAYAMGIYAPPSVFALGDSYTEGLIGDSGGWRARMETFVDWKGLYTDPTGRLHAGRGGDWTVHPSNPDMIDRFATQWASNQAQEVWVTGGTNDIIGGYTAEQAATNLSLLLDEILTTVPAGTVVRVGTPPPWNDLASATPVIEQYWRTKIAKVVAQKRLAGHRVYMHHTGGNVTQLGLDGTISEHPLDTDYGVDGYGLWAEYVDRWIQADEPLDPATLSPVAWFRASVGYNATTGVWSDQSGNGRDASPTGAAKPTVVTSAMGAPALRFASSPLRTGTGWSLTQPTTIFFIISSINSSGSPALFDGALLTNRNSAQTITGTNILALYAGTTALDSDIDMTGVGHLFAIEFNGASSKFWLDGCPRSQTLNLGTQNLDGLTIGGSSAAVPTNLVTSGDFSELLVLPGAYTDDQHFRIAQYFRGPYQLWPRFGKTTTW